jgi:hypothetical protein
MAPKSQAAPIYEAAATFRDRCLVDGTSFLWPTSSAWSKSNVSAVYDAVVEHPDSGKRKLLEKLEDQMKVLGLDAHRIIADVFLFYELFPSHISAQTKTSTVLRICQWKLGADLPNADALQTLFAVAVGGAGPHYTAAQYWAIAYYLDFFTNAVTSGTDAHDAHTCQLIADESAKRIQDSTEARNIVLHLLFPDSYEPIVGGHQKRLIANKFKAYTTTPITDVDQALRDIRKSLTPRFGENFDWYSPNVRPAWDVHATNGAETGEGNPEPDTWIEKTIVRGRPDREAGEFALGRALWSPTKDRRGADIYRFMREVKPGDRILHLTDNEAFVGTSVASSTFEPFQGLKGTDWEGAGYLVRLRDFHRLEPPLSRDTFFGAAYTNRLRGLTGMGVKNVFFESEPNLALRQGAYLTPAPPDLVAILNDAYHDTTGKGLFDSGSNVAPPNTPPAPSMSFDDLVAETLWTRTALEELIEALSVKEGSQVVLAGPPGTGKTWVARWLVRYLTAGHRNHAKLIQFHPSYSYEQFIEGLRPVVDPKTNAIQFVPVEGIVLDFVKNITAGGADYFLIIDEMNRANLPRVLGELMFLFEYRDEKIDLPYTKGFRLPRELRFIGTMNTADRSIRSIDIALRRRFDVFECPADAEILSRYYETRENRVPDLVAGFERLNAQLSQDLDEHHTIGQSFFMANPMTPEQLRKSWRRKLLPLIREYFFDQPDRVSGYELPALWPSLA